MALWVRAQILWVWVLSPCSVLALMLLVSFVRFWILYKCTWRGLCSDILLFPLHPPTLPISFPAIGALLSSDGHVVGQREWNKRQRPLLHALSPFCLLVTKCWCYSSKLYLVFTFDLYSNSIDFLVLISRGQIPFFPCSCQCSDPSRNWLSKGIKLFSEKSSYTNWS